MEFLTISDDHYYVCTLCGNASPGPLDTRVDYRSWNEAREEQQCSVTRNDEWHQEQFKTHWKFTTNVLTKKRTYSGDSHALDVLRLWNGDLKVPARMVPELVSGQTLFSQYFPCLNLPISRTEAKRELTLEQFTSFKVRRDYVKQQLWIWKLASSRRYATHFAILSYLEGEESTAKTKKPVSLVNQWLLTADELWQVYQVFLTLKKSFEEDPTRYGNSKGHKKGTMAYNNRAIHLEYIYKKICELLGYSKFASLIEEPEDRLSLQNHLFFWLRMCNLNNLPFISHVF